MTCWSLAKMFVTHATTTIPIIKPKNVTIQ
jgi:hypothetical protein